MAAEQKSLAGLNYQPNVSDYTTTIYSYDTIKKEAEVRYANATGFATEIQNSESSRHSYEIACIVIIPLLTIGALVAYFFKKSWIILTISIILFAFIAPACVILGLNTSYFLVSIDFCQDINKYITSDSSPIAHRGIGMYLSCPAKPVQIMINTAKYELGHSFDNVINSINNTLITKYKEPIGIGYYKRNNSQFIAYAKKYENDTDLVKGLNSLVYTNDILQNLTALSDCQMADDAINYTEETFCYENIKYEFNNLFFYFIGTVGLVLLTIGVNKLIVLLSPAYLKLNKKNGMELLGDESQ